MTEEGWGDKVQTAKQKNKLDDESEPIFRTRNSKEPNVSLFDFSQKVHELGFKINKMKKLISFQTSTGKQEYAAIREDAKVQRDEIRDLLGTFDSSKSGDLQKARVERIKVVFDQIDKKLEQLDIDINATIAYSDQEQQDLVNEAEQYGAGSGSSSKSGQDKKKDEQKSLTGWQERNLYVEKRIQLETNSRAKSLKGDFEEINTMFKNMNTLVDQQGAGLNVIQQDVEESVENVEVAVEKLKVGNSNSAASRWKVLIFAALMVLVSLLIVLGVYLAWGK